LENNDSYVVRLNIFLKYNNKELNIATEYSYFEYEISGIQKLHRKHRVQS